jgi:type IV pilus assembly protein PilW
MVVSAVMPRLNGQHGHRHKGITLVELMIAMVLGLLVAAGIITVFISTSNSNKAQMQLARLQEEGRFAITRMSADLRMANGQYCTNSGGVAQVTAGGMYMDHVRAPKVYARHLLGTANGASSGALGDVTTVWGGASGSATYPTAPRATYSMPSFLFMRGYDCTLAACAPVDPSLAGLPATGTTAGSRVKGTDVITMRYVEPSSGWAIGSADESSISARSADGRVASIILNPRPGEQPRSNFTNGDLVMLANCSGSQIFAADYAVASGTLSVSSSENFDDSHPIAPSVASAARVFDVNRDLQTVTYYLKLVSVNNDGKLPLTGALIRRVNGGLRNDGNSSQPGGSEDELVRGIERMDFQYAVDDADGNTRFLSAQQIDASTNCPPGEIEPITSAGCLWRGIKSIEVSVLMDGQTPLFSLGPGELGYVYGVDHMTQPTMPQAHPIRPSDQGFVDQMLRREFTALVAVRNYNP